MGNEDDPVEPELNPQDSGLLPEDDSTQQPDSEPESPPRPRKGDGWPSGEISKDTGKLNSTLFAIEAHSGEHEVLSEEEVAADPAAQTREEASVTESLKKAKGGQNQATMYGPTRPGSAKVGSTHATQFGPTEGGRQRPPSGMAPVPSGGPGTMQSAGSTGQHPVAPFGAKIVVGTRVGQVEITGVLGKGGMGEVFRGYHHALDIQVAVKVLPDELSRNDLVRQRFLREARLCVKLDHPNIVRVFNVDEYAGNLFLTMELVEGTDAAHMLKNGGRFKYRRALEIGAACADALAYANTQQGLVHRDVKPHNMLLGSQDGKIKLSDFGLARATASSSHLTMSGQIMGTPHYMSPEQAEAKEVTDKSDVYSLGVTLYHMLTGETPFVGDTPISVAVQHIAKEILYPEARFAPFPKELVAVLKRMTAKDPTKRCSAKQAAVWLRKLATMAPADDIQAAPDAMATMAPVVRESQAFEAAAKAREEHDERAREAARTMLATVREAVGVEETQQEAAQRQASQQVPAVAPKGKGSLIAAAAIILILLGGGGAAAWYFMLGPGATKANNAPIVAEGNSNTRSNTDSAHANGGANTQNSPPANNSSLPSSNIITTPPPAQDDPLIANKLSSAGSAIAGAKTVADLGRVKDDLDQISLELGKASKNQRQEYDNLVETYERQHAFLSAGELAKAIDDGVDAFRKQRDTELPKALEKLNSALIAGAQLESLAMPPKVNDLVGPKVKAALEKLGGEVSAFDKSVSAEAATFENNKLFDKAEEQLGYLAGLKLKPARLAELRAKRTELKVRGLHASIVSTLDQARAGDDSQYKKATDLLAQAERAGVPATLKSAHDDVSRAVKEAVEGRLSALLGEADARAMKGEFALGRSAHDKAKNLPLGTDQNVKLGNEIFYLALKEQLYQAEKQTELASFTEAKNALGDARGKIDSPGERTVPSELIQRYDTALNKFERARNQKFDALLASAEASMKEKDFKGASKSMQEAGELPGNPELELRLKQFREQNSGALAAYVVELLGNIDKALESGDFAAATENLNRVGALDVPKEQQARLDELRTRFSTEAIRRHADQLKAGETALTEKRYVAVRNALDLMKKIPIEDTTRRQKEKDLETRFGKTLTDDVNGRLKSADDLMGTGKFKEAREAIAGATGIAITDDLRESVKRKNEDLDARIETTFSDLLRQAREARTANLFDVSDKKLADAVAIAEVLDPKQKLRLSEAQDEHNKQLAAYIGGLFRKLEGHVERGEEAEGKKVVAVLQAQQLSSTEREKLKRLNEALTGETEAARIKRLPPHLQKLAGDRYCKAEQVFKIGEMVTAVYATTDGKFGACGTESGKVIFYNLKRGTQLAPTTAGRRRITALAINVAGTAAVAGNDDGAVVMFALSGSSVQAFPLENVNGSVNGAAFSPDGKVAFVLARKGEVTRFNVEARTKAGATPSGISPAQAMALSPDGNLLAVGGDEGQVALFDAVRMVLRLKLQGPSDDLIRSVSFSADNKQLVAGSDGDVVALWEIAKLSAKPNREYKGLSDQIRGVGFSPDGKRVAGIDTEKRLLVWDAGNPKVELKKLELKYLAAEDKDIEVESCWIAPDGTMLIGTKEGEFIHMTVRGAGG